MSTSYIGSDALTSAVTPTTVPGFDLLQSYSYAPSSAAPVASLSNTSSATSTGQNPYQQQVTTLETWANQYLMQSLSGTPSLDPLYATAGLNADQFANLATELQNLGSPIGGLVNSQA